MSQSPQPPESPALSALSRWSATLTPVIVLMAGALALLTPSTFIPMAPAVPWLLALIMLGMGMTLKGADFAIVARKPWALLIGTVAHYVIMPGVAWLLTIVLHLEPMLAIGVILVGCCPSGTASNVMNYLAKGDVALSVAMATVSTLLAPILTPLLVLLVGGHYLPVDAGGLLVSILQVVLAPIFVGLLLRRLFPRFVVRITPVLPLVSVLGIALVVLAVVSGAASSIMAVAGVVLLAVVLHNLAGYLLGYGAARVAGLDAASRRTVAFEVGMQNSGLAVTLAAQHFNPVAALPGAMFSVWHNVSGSLLAAYWSRRPTTPPSAADDGRLSLPRADARSGEGA